jgi:hypothetical protein
MTTIKQTSLLLTHSDRSLKHVQAGSAVHQASYPMGTAAISLGVKRPRREANQSPPFIAKRGAIPLRPQKVKHQGQHYLHLILYRTHFFRY